MPIASTTAKIQTAIAVDRLKEGGRAAVPRVGREPFIDASIGWNGTADKIPIVDERRRGGEVFGRDGPERKRSRL